MRSTSSMAASPHIGARPAARLRISYRRMPSAVPMQSASAKSREISSLTMPMLVVTRPPPAGHSRTIERVDNAEVADTAGDRYRSGPAIAHGFQKLQVLVERVGQIGET